MQVEHAGSGKPFRERKRHFSTGESVLDNKSHMNHKVQIYHPLLPVDVMPNVLIFLFSSLFILGLEWCGTGTGRS